MAAGWRGNEILSSGGLCLVAPPALKMENKKPQTKSPGAFLTCEERRVANPNNFQSNA
jgi:hypothetical protein